MNQKIIELKFMEDSKSKDPNFEAKKIFINT